MKILHTSDWHLGQRLYDYERYEEHERFLTWLVTLIRDEKIDLLLIAGDIFDVGNPPHQAQELYYNFMLDIMRETNCRNLVIVGGNHDSPGNLNVSKDILRFLQIYVIGGATPVIEDEIVEIRNVQGKDKTTLQAIVGAVPFLRDADVRYSMSNESIEEKEGRIRKGIQNHYEKLKDAILDKYDIENVPILATGHLFAQGATFSEPKSPEDEEAHTSKAEKDIYIGNLGKVGADAFPKEFDYVALGHIHRQQKIGKNPFIRYSGSPIPLSFSEYNNKHSVIIIEADNGKIEEKNIQIIPTEISRKLLRIKGNLEEVKEKIKSYRADKEYPLGIWVEITVQIDKRNPQLETILRDFAEEYNPSLTILAIRTQYDIESKNLQEILKTKTLDQLSHEEVFILKCQSENRSEKEIEELKNTFKILLYEIEKVE